MENNLNATLKVIRDILLLIRITTVIYSSGFSNQWT
ncbi:hypothetical protein B4U80_01570 [Leptotrombidium deliense]|uniref:Uncharacterized protein n=1 Tax=Leptotrombidium deliense TaxID=299467 RepID=A0A443S6I3_9ACAR|nr:hypothetical protein B4U80_01570 [Leptotrombidium deliense]